MGDSVRARAEVVEIHASKPVVTLSTRCFEAGSENGRLLMDGAATVMIPQELYEASLGLKSGGGGGSGGAAERLT